MIKKISLGLVGFLILLLIVSALLPAQYHVERSITVNATPNKVYPLLQNFAEWEKWSVWASLDPNQKVSVTGEPGKPGHKQEWDGPINGKGSMTIDAAESNVFLKMNLVFEEPQPMVATSKFELKPEGTKTIVIWHNEGALEYPIGRFFGLFLDSMLGKDFETGLAKLKEVVEKQ
ncbi:polyketide cyclase/dehydrase and lipid transport [Leptospira yanagawae serovar Saopaulo str. Sao Paulo = ATCC 700523]|uniref:Polyketide cyclase/dehydrase and lipid transport n=1 Tax=Leptospira yanagawae serovar Saopaulo str. Sao Paulo = ATCC 700523 TaxID=1249483 RepID=A0A5E8HHA4_9LEPT|nr:SRPBCC family protein [Leptospira yanagawae]EOQ90217.1 polyketide cyclase/dehydrase and lipid transport [Leptospira yanagawae serovar Saopaulo str. Sao Paulo = ATCC 700523]